MTFDLRTYFFCDLIDSRIRNNQCIRSDFPECDLQIGRNNGLCSYYAEKGGILVGYEAN